MPTVKPDHGQLFYEIGGVTGPGIANGIITLATGVAGGYTATTVTAADVLSTSLITIAPSNNLGALASRLATVWASTPAAGSFVLNFSATAAHEGYNGATWTYHSVNDVG